MKRLTLITCTIALLLTDGLAFAQTDPTVEMPIEAPNEVKNAFISGINSLNSGDNESASARFAEVNKVLPNFVPARLNNATALEKCGRMREALIEIETAARIKPDDKLVLNNLGRAYQITGQSDKAIKQYERLLWLYPEADSNGYVKNTIRSMKKENQNKDIFADSKGKDEYLAEALSKAAMRWSKTQMPIPVFIKSAQGVQAYQAQYSEILKQSFSDWAQASSGLLSFKLVNDPDSALIECSWTFDRSKLSSPIEEGETLVSGVKTNLQKANIVLLTSSSDPKAAPNIKTNCLHEIGHALGLLGHSSDPDDIMFMFSKTKGHKASLLSERDKKTIQTLYSMTEPKLESYGQNIRQGDSFFHEERSDTEKAVRANIEGNEAFNNGKFLQAAQLFEEAIRLCPGLSAYAINAGNAYLKLGVEELKAKNYIKAQKHLELSAKFYLSAKRTDLAAVSYEALAQMARSLKSNSDAMIYQNEAMKMRLKSKH